jgi:hypothetical protein
MPPPVGPGDSDGGFVRLVAATLRPKFEHNLAFHQPRHRIARLRLGLSAGLRGIVVKPQHVTGR